GSRVYRTLLVWPYAVAPAVAGVLWLFLFNPTIGLVSFALRQVGYRWNHLLNGHEAMLLVVLAAAWKQVSYNFIFFLAGLAGVGRAVLEAAALDGAGPVRRFVSIVFPLLSPTMFFLVVVNIVYAFFETFGIVHAVTGGGPARATEILVYKVFKDGFVGLDLGRSAAQSVVLMAIVIGLTVVQFRHVERKVHFWCARSSRDGPAPAGPHARHPCRPGPRHPRGGVSDLRDVRRVAPHARRRLARAHATPARPPAARQLPGGAGPW